MHKQRHAEDGRNDPLLSVNTNSPVLSVENTPSSSSPLTHELRGTWRKWKIFMIFIFAITIVAIGILMYGCIQLARASNNSLETTNALKRDIASFEYGGYVQLQKANFTLCTEGVSHILASTEDPDQYIVDKNTDDTEYNSTVFQVSGIAFNMNILPIPAGNDGNNSSTASNDFNDDSSNYTIEFVINYCQTDTNSDCDNSGAFSISVPYYRVDATNSLREGERECSAAGGYYDKASLKCLKLFILTQVCIKVAYNANGWHLDSSNGGYGCVYPFASPGVFEQRNYTTNLTHLLANTKYDFFIRSYDDPYISLQALTSGSLSISDVFTTSRNVGIHLIVLACIVIGVSLALGTILFFVKRNVKRQYKTASRVPHYYSRPPMFRYLILSIASFGICVGVGFPLLGHWSEILAWTYTPFIGLMLVIWSGPIGIVSLLIFWQLLLKTPQWNTRIRSCVGGAVGAVLMVLCAFAVAILMKPWRFVYSTNPNAPDQLQVFFGIIVVLTFFPFATLLLVVCAHLFFKDTIPETDRTKIMISSGVISHRAAPGVLLGLLGLFVLFVVFLATGFLPPIWNIQTVGVYNIFVSPYSIVPANSSNIAVIKLYLDVVVFYGFILVVVIVALLASISVRIRRIVGHWIRVRVGKYVVDSSVGEIAFILLVIALSVWWFWWWYFGYGRIAQITDTLERLARVFGHMCNLFAALLLFPVTRNSMWVEILGIPFERAIKYHRWAGVVVFIALTCHMLVWWINWTINDSLLHNIFSVQNIPHADNWSIPMVELTWLGAAVMVLLSQNWFRRRRFELFYYTHHFFIVFFITGLIHSWSMWYFTGGGMILWFIDRLIRYYKSAQTFPVVDIQVHNKGDTTQITLQPNGFPFRAGQYAFVNIPSITPLEWHPFTISSSPGDTSLTFHIKNMGKNTWTARLARIYGGDGDSVSKVTALPIVNIDGPYGNPPDFRAHKNVLLVAGGIGITPMISILKDLYQLYKQNDAGATSLKSVYLIWVVRDLAILDMFKDAFDEIANDLSCKDVFHIMLRVTQRSFSSKAADAPPFNPTPIMGRPNLHQEFADIATICGTDVLAMVCGPAPMVKEVQNAAYHCKFELHMETFEL